MNRGVGTTGLDTRALTIDPSDPQTVYVGTGGFEGPPRIYKTRDGGTTWASVYEGPSNFSIGSLSIDPVDPQKIYVVVAGNVFTSTDGGNNWFQIYDSQNLVPVRFLTLALANPQVLYAGTDDSPPLMSTDGGQTWTQIQGGLPGPEPGRS